MLSPFWLNSRNENVMQIIFQLDMPNQILSLTIAFMNYNSLVFGLRNTLIMSLWKNSSTWPMTTDETLTFVKKYKTSEVTNRLLFLVTKDLQKPCQALKLLWYNLKVGISKLTGNINALIGFFFLKLKSRITLKLLKPLYHLRTIGNLNLIDGYKNSSGNVINWLVRFRLPDTSKVKLNLVLIYLVLWKRPLALMKPMETLYGNMQSNSRWIVHVLLSSYAIK